jgi:hypothetical protein
MYNEVKVTQFVLKDQCFTISVNEPTWSGVEANHKGNINTAGSSESSEGGL